LERLNVGTQWRNGCVIFRPAHQNANQETTTQHHKQINFGDKTASNNLTLGSVTE
jgi:hypothetical protein